ncbi:DNA cytosine methyltransferase [Pseudidiomarina halophila]|uniref:DNA (cytosine-5-)-methyltransferase n=1 Tax=Pseudidiomarina halophila TaxID=1449799 RepID=A0A432XZ33_9GAMM|nr:DNA (cytosine-5-)-methyltransferase [Pseudidiomarina halophila]RUO54008.1 DNA (cytosine-5-)-methyltransferase [Pseudidiomarina halophila]
MNFAEFFAGVGLVREGLSHCGWECVWANDYSADKEAVYVANYGGEHFALGDVWQAVSTPDIVPDDVFLYTASFPCTDLSVAGARQGLAGKESGSLGAVIQLLASKDSAGNAPPVVMLENVRGFLTSHEGLDVINTVANFNKLGYVVDILEIDAIHFVPQSRPRVFLFAVKEWLAEEVMKIKPQQDLLEKWWLDFQARPLMRPRNLEKVIKKSHELQWGLLPVPDLPQRTSSLKDIVETEVEESFWWSKERSSKLIGQMAPSHLGQLQAMMNSSVPKYGAVYRRVRKGISRAEIRTDGVAGCLRTPKGGSSKQILIEAHNGEYRVRYMTPREYARLQGVRDDFVLPDNHNKAYFAMGDAVCVDVLEFIGNEILTPLYNAYVEKADARLAG